MFRAWLTHFCNWFVSGMPASKVESLWCNSHILHRGFSLLIEMVVIKFVWNCENNLPMVHINTFHNDCVTNICKNNFNPCFLGNTGICQRVSQMQRVGCVGKIMRTQSISRVTAQLLQEIGRGSLAIILFLSLNSSQDCSAGFTIGCQVGGGLEEK